MKYLIPIFIIPIIIILLNQNNKNNFIYIGILLTLTGIIGFIFKYFMDIFYFLWGVLSILFYFSEKWSIYIFCFLLVIIIIDFIRFLIYNLFKNRKNIKHKDDIEILHYILYSKILEK